MSRPPRARLVTIAVVLVTGRAEANQPPPNFEETEALERWSWAPLVSAVYAAESTAVMDDGTTGVFAAELRVRYGKARDYNDRHGEDTPTLIALGIGVSTSRFETVEPYGVIGLHWLPVDCDCWGRRLWADLRVDVGFGRAIEANRSFVHTKLGAGALFSKQVKYDDSRYEHHKTRFRAQLDLVIITDVFTDGEYRVGFGFEFDPLRILGDAQHYIR